MTFGMQGATGFEVLQFSNKVHAKVECDLAIDTQHADAMRCDFDDRNWKQNNHNNNTCMAIIIININSKERFWTRAMGKRYRERVAK